MNRARLKDSMKHDADNASQMVKRGENEAYQMHTMNNNNNSVVTRVPSTGIRNMPGSINNSETYFDDKGYQINVVLDRLGRPFQIEIGKAGSEFEKTKEIINAQTLKHYGVSDVYISNTGQLVQGVSGYDKILRNIRKQAISALDFAQLYSQYQLYQVQPISPEELQRRVIYNKAKEQWKSDFDKMYRYYGGGLTCEGNSSIWDDSIQGGHLGYCMFVTDKKTDYSAMIELGVDGKISCVALESPLTTGKNTYAEVIDMETLQKQGYSKYEAEIIIQQKAEQIKNGTSLKQMFMDNRNFMGEQSQIKLNKDMETYYEKQTPNVSNLRVKNLAGR